MGTLARDDFYEALRPQLISMVWKREVRTTKSRRRYYESTAGWNDANAFNETAHYMLSKKIIKQQIF